MIATLNNKSESPEVADPRDIRKGYIAAVVVLAILFIILFFFTYQKMDPPPMDVVVKTETTLEELDLKELVVEPGGGGATSPTDAAPSPTNLQQVLTGKSSTSTTQTGKPNGTGEGDNPFGKGGLGGGEKGGYAKDNGLPKDKIPLCPEKPKPNNYESIKDDIEIALKSSKNGKATIKISYFANGKFKRIISIDGLNASEAIILNKIKSYVQTSYCDPCDAENKDNRTFTFDIKLKQ
jgi:hypothetical protein